MSLQSPSPSPRRKLPDSAIIAFAVLYPLGAFLLNEVFPIIACFPNLLRFDNQGTEQLVKLMTMVFYIFYFWGPGLGALVFLPYTNRQLVKAVFLYILIVVPLSLVFGFLLVVSGGTSCQEVVAQWRARGWD